jgi:pyruvate dehydrogenase complex dehydrogenase (E1) component
MPQHERENDPTLALWFTPQAIRDHFDGSADEIAEWVKDATDEELLSVGEEAIGHDYVLEAFASVLGDSVEVRINADKATRR